MPIEHTLASTTQPTLNDPPATESRPVVTIDVKAFVGSRALVQANSGGGKSRTLRRILEQTYGEVQHIVIDVEGEFYTLREKFDYVIAGQGFDCAATVKNAAPLARMLLETGASAVLDISELGEDQAEFVAAFCTALVNAPRDLWHLVMVVIDEAQRFCPQDEEAVSTRAVIDLMTRGRKRGFNGVLACQRLSELHKSAAAECNNLIIGRTSLDVDIKRARAHLGMSIKEAAEMLPRLRPGQFFCVGPGLAETVTQVQVGHVETTHPEAGYGAVPVVPPRAVTKAMLAKLSDIEVETKKEASELEQLRARVRELENGTTNDQATIRALRSDDSVKQNAVELTRLRKQVYDLEQENEVLNDVVEEMVATCDSIMTRYEEIKDKLAHDIADPILELRNMYADKMDQIENKAVQDATVRSTHYVEALDDNVMTREKYLDAVDRANADEMPALYRALLTVLVQRGSLPKGKVLLFAGYAASGHVSKAFAAFIRNGWIASDGNVVGITTAGRKALGPVKPLPRGVALQQQIREQLPSDLHRKLFDVVVNEYPRKISKGDALRKTGYAASGHVSKAFAYLVRRDFLKAQGPGNLVAGNELFE